MSRCALSPVALAIMFTPTACADGTGTGSKTPPTIVSFVLVSIFPTLRD